MTAEEFEACWAVIEAINDEWLEGLTQDEINALTKPTEEDKKVFDEFMSE